MAPKSDTKAATAPTFLFYEYEKDQKTFGWLNPRQAQIRSAAKRARMREEKAAKRDYARPQESWPQRRRQVKKTS